MPTTIRNAFWVFILPDRNFRNFLMPRSAVAQLLPFSGKVSCAGDRLQLFSSSFFYHYIVIISMMLNCQWSTIIVQEFVNFLLVAKFHGVHSSSHAQIYPDYVISSWLHNSIFFVFIGEV